MSYAPTDIAIVSAACRFPHITDIDALHERLCSGEPVYERTGESATTRDESYVPVTSDMGAIEDFDPAPFGMSAREAELLDPQARVLHELCLVALDQAGHGYGKGIDRTGVILGSSHPAFLHDRFPHFDPLGMNDPVGTMEASLGSFADYLATGIAHRLSLTGPAFTVQTACSTSLVAVHLGVQQLLLGESDAVLVGGVTLHVPQGRGYTYVPDGPFSASGRTSPYSAHADGAVFTQGAGVVLLRRARDAVRDKDPILGVIAGSAVNNDGGRSAGLVAPSVDAHAEVVREALDMAGLQPGDVSYVEGHGTGTALGDPLEISALGRVFNAADGELCRLGSCKAILGHTEAAAGIASLLSVIGALKNGVIPGTIAATANAELNQSLENTRLRLATKTQQWRPSSGVRIAGISSLGFGGTNCHVVIKQPEPQPWRDRAATAPQIGTVASSVEVLRLSAATNHALEQQLTQHTRWVAEHPELSRAAAWTLGEGRKAHAKRSALVVSEGKVVDQCDPRESTTNARILFAFPGGGAQRVGMLEEIVAASPQWRRECDHLATTVNASLNGDVRAVCAPSVYGLAPVSAEDPELGLPALVVAEILCARILAHHGIHADAMIGHSTGEYAAAVLSGAVELDDLAPLLAERSRALGHCPSGAMLRIRADHSEVEAICTRYPSIEISAYNSPRSVVVSGTTEDIEACLEELGSRATRIPVAVAAHSRFVEPAIAAVSRASTRINGHQPKIPVYSSTYARSLNADDYSGGRYWTDHLREPVRFTDTLEEAARQMGDTIVLLHVGPGAALASLAREAAYPQIVGTVTTAAEEGHISPESVALAAAETFVYGAQSSYSADDGCYRIALPPYPFDRTRLWPEGEQVEPADTRGRASAHAPRESLIRSIDRHLLTSRFVEADVEIRHVDLTHATSLSDALVEITNDLRAYQDTTVGAAIVGNGKRRDIAPCVVFHCADPAIAASCGAALRAIDQETSMRALAVCGDIGDSDVRRCMSAGLYGVSATPRGVSYDTVGHRIHLDSGGDEWPTPTVAVILGGRGNVGSALARYLRAAGVRVVQATRQPGTDQVAPTDPEDVARLLRRNACGPDGLVVIATGIVGEAAFSGFAELQAKDWEEHLSAKAAVCTAVAQACEILGEAAPGRVIVMSSLAAHIGGVGLAPYAASNRAGESVTPPSSPTMWTAVASDGWIQGQQNSFGDKLLSSALLIDEALDAMWSVIHHPYDGVCALTGRSGEELGAQPSKVTCSQPEGMSDDPHAGSSAFRSGVALSPTDMGAVDEGAIREHMVRLWEQTLSSKIDDSSDFFALGGSSLQATKLLSQIREHFGVRIRLRHVLEDPTFSGMLKRITEQAREGAGSIVPARNSQKSEPYVEVSPLRADESDKNPRTWPLTPVQRAYVTGRNHSFGMEAGACRSFVETLVSDVDIDRLSKAFSTVIRRHPMLRVVVDAEGHHAIDPRDYVVPVTDCRSSVDPSAALERWRRRHADSPAHTSRWPLVSLSVARSDDGVHLGWSIDVLVCDASSFGVLVDEVARVYCGAELPPAPKHHFAEHVAGLHVRDEDREYWQSVLPQLPPPPPLRPLDAPSGQTRKQQSSFVRVTHQIDTELADSVSRYARARSTTETVVLLSIYAQVLGEMTGVEDMSIMVTVFDRSDVFRGVIGDFTTLVPCPIRLGHSSQAAVDDVSTNLFDAIDHSSMPGPEILALRSELDDEPFRLPVVFTSTLGTDVDGGQHAKVLGELSSGSSFTPQVFLDHQAFRWDGRTYLQFDASARYFSTDRLETMVQRYLEALNALVSGVENTGASDEECHVEKSTAPAQDRLQPIDAMCALWSEVLGVPQVESTSTVRAVGGDSLDAIRLSARLRALEVNVGIDELLDGLTPADIAKRMNENDCLNTMHAATSFREIIRHPSGEPFPLTPLQQAYLVGTQGGWSFSHDSAHFYVDFEDEDVSVDNLYGALDTLVRHQPMLRAYVTETGEQNILDPDDPRVKAVPLEVVDKREASAEEYAQYLDAARAEWVERPLDPRTWPSFRVRASLQPQGGVRVHVQASLLFVDGWSFYVFFDQLFRLIDNPNTVLPQPSLTFADYVATMESEVEASRSVDRQWWLDQIAGLPESPSLPLKQTDGRGMRRDSRRLSRQRVMQLNERTRDEETTPTAVIGAAWSRAVCELTGSEEMLLSVLFFNRQPIAPDVDSILGPFSTTTLVACRPASWGDKPIEGFSTAMNAALAHSSVSGVEVARMISRLRGTRDVVAPVVFTSTVGFDDAAARAATDRIDETDVYERVVTPQVLLDLQASVENGSIAVNLDSPRGAFEEEVTAALVDRVITLVDAFIDNRDEPDAPVWPSRKTNVEQLHDRSIISDEPSAIVDVHAGEQSPVSVARCDDAPVSWGVESICPLALSAVYDAVEAVLGLRPEPTDDLFSLGADSLAMIRIIARLRTDAHLDITPAEFLAAPTPAGVAAMVRPQLDQNLHVLPLSDGRGEPLYLLHPSGGDVLCYMELARQLGTRPVYAIADPGLEGTPMPTELHSTARLYGELILTHRRQLGADGRHGLSSEQAPVLLGGWSMGGTVAQALAAHLVKQQVPVGALFLLDSNSPDRIRKLTGMESSEMSAECARRYLRSVQAFQQRKVDASAVQPGDPAAGVSASLAASGMPPGDVQRRLEVFTRHLAGLAVLQPSTATEVPTLLVIADNTSPANSAMGMGVDDARGDKRLGWGSSLPERTEIVHVPGHHYSILNDESLPIIVQSIQRIMKDAGL